MKLLPTKLIMTKQHFAITTNMYETRDPPWHGFGSGAQNAEYGVIPEDQVRTVPQTICIIIV
jgi:hypothetical protein